jgi:hypothetical protein
MGRRETAVHVPGIERILQNQTLSRAGMTLT